MVRSAPQLAPFDIACVPGRAAAGGRALQNLVLLLVLLSFLSGCSTTYDTRFSYQPRPVISEIEGGSDQERAALVRGIASVIGLRNAAEDEGLPRSVEVRLRLENEGAEVITFDPQALVMYGGNAEPLENPIVYPEEEVEVPPGESVTVQAFFPYDPQFDDVSGLALRWSVQVNGEQRAASAHFYRRVRPSYRSHHSYGFHHYGYHPGYRFGFGYYH